MKRSARFAELDGRLYCVMGQTKEAAPDDVAVLRFLSSREVHSYRQLKSTGMDDSAIFWRMFPKGDLLPFRSNQKFKENTDGTYAIMNWKSRRNSDDTAVLRYLTPGEIEQYRSLRMHGESDTGIFYKIFEEPADDDPSVKPTAPALVPAADDDEPAERSGPRSLATVKIELSRLDKNQLVSLVEVLLDQKMPSLGRSSREDLEKLLASLSR